MHTENDFTAKRLQAVSKENRHLREYVSQVMQQLRDNESLFKRITSLETKVMMASSFDALCSCLLKALKADFSLDLVRLWVGRASLPSGLEGDMVLPADVCLCDEQSLGSVWSYGDAYVFLQSLDGQRLRPFCLDRDADAHIRSIAVLRLAYADATLGVLCLGSVHPHRFTADHGADFLEHLAQIIGISLSHSIARERIAKMATTDALTGVYNRRFLQAKSPHKLSKWFGEVRVSCLYFDLDNFKELNDQYGHAQGDKALDAFAATVEKTARSCDPLVRMGGDEFVLFLPACPQDRALALAENMIEQCQQWVFETITLGVSIGFSYVSSASECTVSELIQRADQAMYIAKALGGNRVECEVSCS